MMTITAHTESEVNRMKIGDRVFVHGYIDEIRKDTVIIRNNGGYFGTIPSEVITGELPSAQPKTPLYVAEIESEYKKWVNVPQIDKPLAKALYEVWKKHDREDVNRNG